MEYQEHWVAMAREKKVREKSGGFVSGQGISESLFKVKVREFKVAAKCFIYVFVWAVLF